MNNSAQNSTVWTSEEFERQLRSLGNRYHIHHPFQVMMNRGELTREQIQGWVCNRFYYQISIPLKDGALISNCPDREVRRQWVQRILDHDGREGHEGGIEAWVRLGEACGLTRDDVESLRHVLPGVRFAVDAYVNFVRRADWREAVSSSLTELFAPTIHKERLANWPKYYPWIDVGGLEYFRRRLKEAHRDVDHGLGLTLQYFTTRTQQEKVIRIVQFKLDVLWTMLDAMYLAYIYKMPPYFNVDENA
jgi:pyrroloquinoline-quinone synthase